MTEANPKPVASEPRPDPGKQPEPEEPPEEPGLPFLPQPISVDPTIAVPEPALTAVTTSEGEPQPVADGGPSRPAQPPPPPPDKILEQPPAAPAGETVAWQSICNYGQELLEMGSGDQTTSATTRLALDRAARVFRASVSDFWSYSRAGIRAEVEAIGDSTRLKKFDATFDDSALVSALDAWSAARRGSPPDWAAIAKAQQDAAVELSNFHGTIDRALPGAGDIERSLLEILEAMGREIGRESAEQVWGSQVDFGTTLGGVTYAVRLASPTEMVLQGARSVLAVQLAKGPRSGKQQTTGQWVKESINAAKLGPSRPAGWADDLATAIDKWAAAAKRVTADSVDSFATLTDTLKSALANAHMGIGNAPKGTGAPRAATRTLDGVTEAVAEQLDVLASQLGAAGAVRLAPAARTLRFTIGDAPTATRPLSKYWSTSKSTALKALPASERTVLNSWFDAGFSAALDDWAAQVAKLPGGDRDKLLARSWTIANTLNRYRVGILRLVSDPAARAPLFDAIDALATAVSSALRQSDEDE